MANREVESLEPLSLSPERIKELLIEACRSSTEIMQATSYMTAGSKDSVLTYISPVDFQKVQDNYRRLASIHAEVASGIRPLMNPRKVRKIRGSFQHTGSVVAEFTTTLGERRLVLEFDAPVGGMLHIYRPDQVEDIDTSASQNRGEIK